MFRVDISLLYNGYCCINGFMYYDNLSSFYFFFFFLWGLINVHHFFDTHNFFPKKKFPIKLKQKIILFQIK